METGQQESGLRLLRAQDLPNVRLRDALLQAVRSLPSRPEPRWRWDNVAANRAAPWRPLFTMLRDAVRHGAPMDDVLAVIRELEGQLRALDPAGQAAPASPSELAVFLVEEARADAPADVAQAEVAAAPSRVALERLIVATELQESKARRLCSAARRLLATPITWRRGIA